MADFYSELAGIAAGVLKEFKQGTLQLLLDSEADGDSSFEPGAVTTQTLVLDGVVDGVEKKYIDGSLVTISDKQLTVSTVAIDAATSAKVTLTRALMDTPELRVRLDGVVKPVKRIDSIPGAGTPVTWLLFVEG